MTLPAADTTITYPDGATSSTGIVLHVEPLPDGRSAVLLDTTAFHPVDTAWPDQPADRGTLTTADGEATVVDVLTGGILDGRLVLGADLPVRTGTEGWVFIVAHIIDAAPPAVGATVHAQVDKSHRAALSAAHTACHLAALALDAALADAWSKPAPIDPLGAPAFDALAIQQSRIHPQRSVDIYRIGKSLRRKGFTPAALEDPNALADRVNTILAEWINAGGTVHIERSEQTLSARRTWACTFSPGRAEIPCGGTHIANLGDLATVTVTLTRSDTDGGVSLQMDTTVRE